jgi:multidrug efflux pump subunit AcrA (membrane-fusion protein)
MTRFTKRNLITRAGLSASLPIAIICLGLGIACRSNQGESSQSKPAAPKQAVPVIATTTIESGEIGRQLRLPGELQAWQEAALSPRVSGFVGRVEVDRGSAVRAGQLLARLEAPELGAKRAEEAAKTTAATLRRSEAESHVRSLRAQRLEAEARLATATATWQRLRQAAATPGVVSGNELEIAQRRVEAEQARVEAFRQNEEAARNQAGSLAAIEEAARASAQAAQNTADYLQITAPFTGRITERFAHPGSLATPGQPILRLQQTTKLRLIVNLPEGEVGTIRPGLAVTFTVPAFPGRTFKATLARAAGALDQRTRTMPVELDVLNPDQTLAPGMFPQILWPANRQLPSMLVPPSAIAVTTERTFLLRIRNNVVEWVDVKRGVSVNLNGKDFVEVFGDLDAGERIAVRGTDELRNGTVIEPAK